MNTNELSNAKVGAERIAAEAEALEAKIRKDIEDAESYAAYVANPNGPDPRD